MDDTACESFDTNSERCKEIFQTQFSAEAPHETLVDLGQSPSPNPCNKGAGLILEIFAGSCRLSKVCRGAGLEALSVDKDVSRAENAVVANFDLCNSSQYNSLVALIRAERHRLVHAHVAPSCGTASKARERPVPGLPKDRQPRPLRSTDKPDGLGNLTTVEQTRVNSANASYDAATNIILLLVELGVSVSVENPKNSLYWLTSMTQRLFAAVPNGHFTIFDSCMHGGARDKATKFWSYNPRTPSINMFQSLALQCNKQHVHQSWKPRFSNGMWIYPTKEEAAYPLLLCHRMASLLLQEAAARGLSPDRDMLQQLEHDEYSGKRQLFTTQARKQTLRPIVSEFGYTAKLFVSLAAAPAVNLDKRFPKGAKIISRQLNQGFKRDVLLKEKNSTVYDDILEGDHFETLYIGVPRDPPQFIEEAVRAGHPRFLLARVGPEAEPFSRDGLRERKN